MAKVAYRVMKQTIQKTISRFCALGMMAGALYGVDLPVVADVHVGASTPQAGALPSLLAGGGNKALLRFHMGLLPAGLRMDQVVKATLVFHVNRMATAGPMQVAQLMGPFEEMTATGANAPFSVMQVHFVPVSGVNAVDVTVLVQNMVSAPTLAHGLEIAAITGSTASVQIDSRENTATSFAAELRVVLTGMAGPTGAQGLQGLPGVAGAKGATGATGATGPAGNGLQSDPQLMTALCAALGQGTLVNTGLTCPPKTVFVTARTVQGNFGSVTVGDTICQTEASQNGLSGTYKAWLSSTSPPAPTAPPNGWKWLLTVKERFTPTIGAYRLVNGTVVAYNFTDLSDGQLQAPINRMANGQEAPSPLNVWTGTTAGGDSTGQNCYGWSSSLSMDAGIAGFAGLTGSQWSIASATRCSESLRLYCMEQ